MRCELLLELQEASPQAVGMQMPNAAVLQVLHRLQDPLLIVLTP